MTAESESTTRSVAIDADGVTVGYGSGAAVVCDVSLHAPAGSITVLLGPSGCGKTTFLRAIAGLERPRAGTIRLGDVQVSGPNHWLPAQHRNVGMVFQDSALFPHLSAADNIAFGLRRLARADRDARVLELLELVEMREFADRLPGSLSGGQQQRIALARSLAPNPAVLLLDEPFSALDASLRTQLRGDVARILRDVGVTTMFVTHDQDEAFAIGDIVGVMNRGRLCQVGTPEDLYGRPSDQWVAAFVGDANVLSAVATDGMALTALGRVPLRAETANGAVEVLIRPEDVAVAAGGEPGVVEHLDYYGHDARVAIRLLNGTELLARVRSRAGLRIGAPIELAYRGGPAESWPVG